MAETKIRKHLVNYGKTTSIKGIGKVIKSQKWFLKALWLFALVAGASIALVLVTDFLIRYFKYATTTKIRNCNHCRAPFPDITVCNLNPLALISALGEDLEYDEYEADTLIALGDSSAFIEGLDLDEGRLNDMKDEIISLSGYFQNIGNNVLELAANYSDFGRMVVDCKWFNWRNNPLGHNNNSYGDCMMQVSQRRNYLYSEKYYICNTFRLHSSLNMDVKGLEAIIYLNDFSSQSFPGYDMNLMHTQGKGARVVIHPPGSYPDLSEGIDISPGKEATLHLNPIQLKRKDLPYSNCTEQKFLEPELKEGDPSLQVPKFIYTASLATGVCKHEYYLRKCKCYHPHLPISNKILNDYPYGNTTSAAQGHYLGCGNYIDLRNDMEPAPPETVARKLLEQMMCYMYDENSQSLDKQCDSADPCEEYIYDFQQSITDWPHESYQLGFYCTYINAWCLCWYPDATFPNGTLMNETEDRFSYYNDICVLRNNESDEAAAEALRNKNLIPRNFIQLKVLFLGPGLVIYEDFPALSLSMMFGNLGGMLNLWIGITFFTIIEILDCMFIFTMDICSKKDSEVDPDKDEVKVVSDSDKRQRFDTDYGCEKRHGFQNAWT